MGTPGNIQSVKVNFTFDELASIVSGKHNLGDLRLGNDGKLHRVNNHASMVGKLFNTQTTSPTENANVRMAIYSVIEAKFGNDAEATPFLDVARDYLLGAKSFANPLSRKEARVLIGKFTAMTANVGKLEREISKVAEKVKAESDKRLKLKTEVDGLVTEYENRLEDATEGFTDDGWDAINEYREIKAKYESLLKDPDVKFFVAAEKQYNQDRTALFARKAEQKEFDALLESLKNARNDPRVKDNPKIEEFKNLRVEYPKARIAAFKHVKSHEVIGAGALDVAAAWIKGVAGCIKESVINLFSSDSRAQLQKLEDKLATIRSQNCSVQTYAFSLRQATPVGRTLNKAQAAGMKNTALGHMAESARNTVAVGFTVAHNQIARLDGNKPEQYRVATTCLLNELEHLREKAPDPRLKAQLQKDIDALRQAFDRDGARDYRSLDITVSRILMRMPEGADKRVFKGFDFAMLAVRREVALAFNRAVVEGKEVKFSVPKHPVEKNGLEQDQRSLNTLRLGGNQMQAFSNALKAGLSPVVRESWNRASPAELKRLVSDMFSTAFKRTIDNLGFARGSVPSLVKNEKDDFEYAVDDFCRQMCEDDSVSVNAFFGKFKDFVRKSFAEAAKAGAAGDEWNKLGDDFCKGLDDALPEIRHFSGVLSDDDAKLVKGFAAALQREVTLAFSPTVASLTDGAKPIWTNLPSAGALPQRVAYFLADRFKAAVSGSPELQKMKFVDQRVIDRLEELAAMVKTTAMEDEESLTFAEFVSEATRTIRDAAESNPRLRLIADSLAETFSAASFNMDKMVEAVNFDDFCASNAAKIFTREFDGAMAGGQPKVAGAVITTIANAYTRSLELLLPDGKGEDPSMKMLGELAQRVGKGALSFAEFRQEILRAVEPGKDDSPTVTAFKRKVADAVREVINNGKALQDRFDALGSKPILQFDQEAMQLFADAYADQLGGIEVAGENMSENIRKLAKESVGVRTMDEFALEFDKILNDERLDESQKETITEAKHNLEPLIVSLREKVVNVHANANQRLTAELTDVLCMRLEGDMVAALESNENVNLHLTAARVLTFALAEEVTRSGLGDCVDFKGMLALAERYVDGELGGVSFNSFVDLVSSTLISGERQVNFPPFARELRASIAQVMQDVIWTLDRFVNPLD